MLFPVRFHLSFVILVCCGSLSAEGFRSPTVGTQGLGNSGGRIAFIDDLSSIAHNPANLTSIDRWGASFEPTLVYHQARFESPTGEQARTRDPWKFLPHGFVGGPVDSEGRFVVGLGVTVPYGLSLDWGDQGPLRYHAPHYVALDSLNFNPTMAFRINDQWSVGVGLNVMWSEIEFKQHLPWSSLVGFPGLPDGDSRARGDGVGVGGNIGVTWQFHPKHRVAVTYRSAMNISYDGNLRTTQTPGVPGGVASAPFSSNIKYPNVVALAYGWQATDRLRAEVNLEWVQFSRFQSLPIDVAAPLSQFSQNQGQDWRDTLTVGIGGQYQLNEQWVVRAGYHHFQSPVPSYTLSPTIPDSAQHVPTVGIGWRFGRHRLDASYGYVFYEDRTVRSNQNPAFIGRYQIDAHLISAAYGWSF